MRALLVLLATLALGALAGVAITLAATSSPASGLQSRFEQVVHTDLASIVEISTPVDIGSGVVFDHKGDIVTNAHVVGSAKTFMVTLEAHGKPVQARLIGLNHARDIAVIRVTSGATALTPVTWANSSEVDIGQIVLAVGTPLGYADTVTQGIVSSFDRTIEETGTGPKPVIIHGAIQTSADINPGNSGGALIDITGDVVGIPTLTAIDPEIGEPAEGIGFAIPSNTVVRIASQLIAHDKGS
jgi:putative serine protease PepD